MIVGNCQAGWQIMMMAAIRPDLAGPIMLAGSPLSYWAGVRGKNPMRYLGGAAGRHLADRAGRRSRQRHLRRRQSGRQLRVAQPGQHLLEEALQRLFQGRHRGRRASSNSRHGGAARCCSTPTRCSGSPTICSSATSSPPARSARSDGMRVDLRNIKSPIIVFCSWGDNITPPQQALGWITRPLRPRGRDRRERPDHRLLACTRRIGHLGIFVSGKVATKEHAEFASCMDMIDLMPPGLYEAVITEVDESTEHPRADPRRVSVPAGGAHARRHPRARRQQRRGRPALRRRRARVGDQPRPLPHARPARRCGRWRPSRSAGAAAADASQPAALRACSPTRTR